MRKILLTLSYDGTDFCGWQRQDIGGPEKNAAAVRTVQAEVERALEKVHHAPTALHGSGRTDSGVHARAQAATFLSPVDSMPPGRYVPALNAFLPPDIRVNAAREVPDDFDARFSATSRTYRYFLHCGASAYAHETRFAWHIRRFPDLARLNSMASVLRGETDCASFAAAGDQSKSTFRYIDHTVFYPEGEKVVFEIRANAFLWKMVRSLAGTFVQLEKAGAGADEFRRILESRDRASAGATAPPTGLFLWSVEFDGVRRHV